MGDPLDNIDTKAGLNRFTIESKLVKIAENVPFTDVFSLGVSGRDFCLTSSTGFTGVSGASASIDLGSPGLGNFFFGVGLSLSFLVLSMLTTCFGVSGRGSISFLTAGGTEVDNRSTVFGLSALELSFLGGVCSISLFC
jgi:hypothetical protein